MNTLSLRSFFAFGLLCATISSARGADSIEYNRDIRPILAENCFACHGQDSAARKAGLRLDRRDDAINAEAFVPGKASESGLIERIYSLAADKQMPPPKSNKKLTLAQKELLKRWIDAGAEYQPHWSFIAPKRPALPKVAEEKWVRNPIDRFILAELEKRGLTPAPEADRRTLARRLSLDLTGLPAEPMDVEAFVKDQSPDYYEKYVDKLMKMPQWGEHRARHWMDAARYADTHGIHFDNYREIWAYRDWLIGAFNRNMPFDQFTIEQLAGDLLPNPTLEQRIATGFNRCNITTNEGGAIAEEYLVLYTRDRTETASQVWLGMTTGCAVCHDHKFDPLSQKEFYQLAAFFNNTTQGAMDGNIKDTPPILFVPQREDRPRWEALTKEIADVSAKVEERKKIARADFDKWLKDAKQEKIATTDPAEGLRFRAALNEGKGTHVLCTVEGQPRELTLPADAAWDKGFVADNALKVKPGQLQWADAGDFDNTPAGFSFGAWVKMPKKVQTGALFSRMDDKNNFLGWDLWVENGRIGTHIVHKWPEDALKVVTQGQPKPGEWVHILVTYDGSNKAAGVKIYFNGVVQNNLAVQADALKSTIRTTVPFKLGQRNTTSPINDAVIQDVRHYGRALPAVEVEHLSKGARAAYLMEKPADKRTPAEAEELFAGWLPERDKEYVTLTNKANTLKQEQNALKIRGTVAHVMTERKEEPTAFILYRGDYDKRRDQVKAATPKALPAWPSDLPNNRLGFARWLLRPENPLPTRVTVNRFWQEIFGTGIVRTSGDFGITGDLPSHPELLDWMAVEFRETGWDVQKFFKMLVTSSTYRQSAITTKEKLEKDLQNRLLSRGPRYRMDAEMVRDYALAASGLLVRTIGGPSVRPYQPDGVWEAVAMIGSDTRDYRQDHGDKLYRRSMYTFWKRAAPPASMEILNAPNRETCAVRRERTNTPLQALVTLNDPQFVEAARHLAQRALLEGGDQLSGQIDFVAQRLLSRPLREDEKKVVADTLADLLESYKKDAAAAKKLIAVGESKANATLDATKLAAWTMLVNELMNLDEVLNK